MTEVFLFPCKKNNLKQYNYFSYLVQSDMSFKLEELVLNRT